MISHAADIFPSLILPTIIKEGGGVLTDDPDDPGGTTIWGITEETARLAGYTGAMAAMTEEVATAIYKKVFWLEPHFDEVYAVMPTLGAYMLDIGVNCGPDVSTSFLQRALNVLNDDATLYAKLDLDDAVGPKTLAALSAYRRLRLTQMGDAVLMGMIRAFAVVYYVTLAELRPVNGKYEYGWLCNRAIDLG
jgi:lysozyme family protein